MKRNPTFFIAFLLLGFLPFHSAFSQCFELGGPVGQLSPVLKNPIGFCPGIAQQAAICDCPAGFVVVGYEGLENNVYGPEVLSQFSLRCKELNPDGTLGAAVVVTCSNGTAVPPTSVPDGPIDAAPNQAIVGFEIRIGCATDAVMGASKPLSEVVLGQPNTVSNPMPGIGGPGGAPQPIMYAPNGNVIVGMQTYIEPLNQPAGAINIVAGVAWRYAPVNDVACAGMCSVDGISVGNISACNDNSTPDPSDDTFTADVTVTFTDAPATGNLNLSGDGTASVAVGSLVGGTHTFAGVSMSADGTAISLTAAFSADAACTLTNSNAGTAPMPCSVALPPCTITNIISTNISACDNNGTPNIISDDTYTADVIVSYANAPATGTLNLTGDGTASVSVGSIGATSYIFTGVTMTADGTPIAFTASFSADAGCIFSKSNTGQAPNQCSVAAPPGAIPTMSEWGLILFALIIFTFSVVFGTQYQQKLAMSGNLTANARQTLPFNKARFFKVLPIVYLGFATVFASAIALFGYELTNADIPGSLLSGLVIAYLIQFAIRTDKK